MNVSLHEMKSILEDLINENVSREQVAFWAFQRQSNYDSDNLEFEPLDEKEKIWRGISYLTGVDLKDFNGDYLHSIDNFIEFRNKYVF